MIPAPDALWHEASPNKLPEIGALYFSVASLLCGPSQVMKTGRNRFSPATPDPNLCSIIRSNSKTIYNFLEEPMRLLKAEARGKLCTLFLTLFAVSVTGSGIFAQTTAPGAAKKSQKVEVPGNKEWIDTKIDVRGGAKLRFTAT